MPDGERAKRLSTLENLAEKLVKQEQIAESP